MLIKPITYLDLDDNQVTQEYHFNLSKAELAKLSLQHEGGFASYLRQISEANNADAIMKAFEDIIKMTIGRREGNQFLKSDEITNEFVNSGAYSELFYELATDAKAGAKFINAVVPKDVREQITGGTTTDVELPAQREKPIEQYSMEEFIEMGHDAFSKLMQANKHNLPKSAILAKRFYDRTNQ